MTRKIYIIVPDYKPTKCGVSDHADVLRIGLETHKWTAIISDLIDFEKNLDDKNLKCLFIEFVLFGYQRLGLPSNVLRITSIARKMGIKVFIYFHELPASFLPIRKSSFLVPIQKQLCSLIAKRSDGIFVNQTGGLNWLADKHGSSAKFIPTWSGVGELRNVNNYLDRQNIIAVFGTPGKRTLVHRKVLELGGYRKLFGNDVKVLDIGDVCSIPQALSPELNICGLLNNIKISWLLSEAKYGLFYCPLDQVSKSSVFAAYCAHGVIPINIDIDLDLYGAAKLIPNPGQEFMTIDKFEIEKSLAGEIFKHSRDWYHKYSIKSSMGHLINIIDSILNR